MLFCIEIALRTRCFRANTYSTFFILPEALLLLKDAKMDKTRDKKRKHADVLQPEPWHPARTVLMRLSSKPAVTAHDARLSESLRPSLQGPLKEVSSCINKMLRQGQSTSLAVIGPQGVGKSLVRPGSHQIHS